VLDDNKYTLTPYRSGGDICTDVLGNTNYSITLDYNTLHQRDLLVLWDIPNKNYIKVDYKVEGDSSKIGSGKNGRDRGDIVYVSPAPVIEIFGDAVLSWTGVTSDGTSHSQTSSYDYANGTWDIGRIKTTKKGSNDE